MNYNIREIDPDRNLKKILEFNKKYWPDSILSREDILHWRNVESAKVDKTKIATLAVTNKANEIFGTVHGIPGSVLVENQKFDIMWPVDFILASELRGSGMGKKLILSIVEQNQNVIGLGGTPPALRLYRKLGWKISSEVKTFIKIPSTIEYFREDNSHIYRRLIKLFYFNFKNVYAFSNQFNTKNHINLKKVNNFKKDMEKFINPRSVSNTIINLRPIERINWLCEKIPLPKAQYFSALDKGEVVGYIIIRIQKNSVGLMEGRILDIFCNDMKELILIEIIKNSLRVFKKHKVNLIRTIASHPNFKNACRKCGFAQKNINPLIYMSELPFELKDKFWHITMMDSDFSYR
jgi:GNAT superfamily N-acetyltransferase